MIDASSNSVPEDFPRRSNPTALSGVQPKLGVRLLRQRFTDEWTDDELNARFDVCADLVEQLVAYCRRKLKDRANESLSTFLPRVQKSITTKGWDLTDAEVAWVMGRLGQRLQAEQKP